VHLLIGTIIVSIRLITKCFSQLLPHWGRENIVDLAYGYELSFTNIVLKSARTL